MQSVPAGNLLALLAEIPDPRGRQGRRHCLAAMLAAVVCSVMTGARGYKAIAQWLHAQEVPVWHLLGFRRRPPKQGAFRKLLLAVPPPVLEAVIERWMAALAEVTPQGNGELRGLALDGKSLCRSLAEHGRAVHLLSAFDHALGCVLSQRAVGDTNEAKASLDLLQGLLLRGRVVTGDAAFCQREICQEIIDSGGDYLIAVKDNQPTLLASCELAFKPVFSPRCRVSAAG